MPKQSERGFIQFIALFLLVAGIIGGIYLVQHPTLFRPKAANEGTRIEFVDASGNPITSTTSQNVKVKLTYVPPVGTPTPPSTLGCSFTDFRAAYGKSQNETGFNANCDVNVKSDGTIGDGQITILDWSVLRNAFLTSSSPTPTPSSSPSVGPSSVALTASPATIDVGNPITFIWDITGNDIARCQILGGNQYVPSIWTGFLTGDDVKNGHHTRSVSIGGVTTRAYTFSLFCNRNDGSQPGIVSTQVTINAASTPTSQASITANPNPVPAGAGLGNTIISWNTGDGSVGQVRVASESTSDETLLLPEGATGTLQANWIQNGDGYIFFLYRKTDNVLLSQVHVVRTRQPRNTTDAGGGSKVAGIKTVYAQSVPFPTSFRITNNPASLEGNAPEQNFDTNGKVIDWILSDGYGQKTVYVQFKVMGVWQPAISASIEYNPIIPSPSPSSSTPPSVSSPSVTLSADKTTINSGDSIIFTWIITGGDMSNCRILGHTSNISDVTTNNWNDFLAGNDDAGNNVLKIGTHSRRVTIGQQAAAQAPTYNLACVSTNGTPVNTANVTVTVTEPPVLH